MTTSPFSQSFEQCELLWQERQEMEYQNCKTGLKSSSIQTWEQLLEASNKRHQLTPAAPLPGRFMGKQISDLFLWGGPSLVLARRHIQSAWVPLVVHIFPPFITYSSPFLTALVTMPEPQRSGLCRKWKKLRHKRNISVDEQANKSSHNLAGC